MDVMTFFVQENRLMLEEADQSWGPWSAAPPWWHVQVGLPRSV